MEIKNVSIFFISVVIMIIGSFVVVFDYPQIQYFENMESESYALLDNEHKNIHQRLKIELLIGIIILAIGTLTCGFSFIKK